MFNFFAYLDLSKISTIQVLIHKIKVKNHMGLFFLIYHERLKSILKDES